MCMNGRRSKASAGIPPWRRWPAASRTPRRSRRSSHEQAFPLVEPGALTFAWRGEADRCTWCAGSTAGADRRPFARLRRHRPLAAAPAGRGRRPLRVQARRSAATAARSWIVDPLNPARADDPFGENSVCRTLGYGGPEWSQPRGAPAGRVEEIAGRERRLRRDPRACGSTCRPATTRTGALSARRRPRRRRLRHLRRPAGGARQPDRRRARSRRWSPRWCRPATGSGEYSGGRRHARYLVGELLPALAARWRIAEAPGDRVLLGASLGAVASLVDRLPLSRLLRRAGAEVGLLHLRRAQARAPAAPGLPPHRAADARAAPRAAAAADARLRLDRRARGAGRREPRACKLLARTRRRCFVQERVGRPPLAQLARPAPRRAALGAPARSANQTADGAAPRPARQRGDGMGERTVNIGLSLGADICWPIAYESLLAAPQPRPRSSAATG